MTAQQPNGSMLLRTLAMPADTNPSGDIFGGWLMAQMDIGGAILAKELSRGRVVCVHGQCTHVGRSSIKVKVEVWVKKVANEPIGQRFIVTEAAFTYVAVDGQGKPRPIPRDDNPELDTVLASLAAAKLAPA